jgi:N-acetyl-anhydromuramyl-L-alanine amidase AmpD
MLPTLSKGSSGQDVRRLQAALQARGFSLAADGIFGPGTELAVRNFQTIAGLAVDGVVGPKTWTAVLTAPTPADNVADPGEPVVTAAAFQASMLDRRGYHTALLRTNGRPREYTPRLRPWPAITGTTLHQTACDMGERVERYDTIGAHFTVLRNSGRVLWHVDLDRIVYHGNGWNDRCVGIEVNGLYAGLEDDPDTALDEALKTTWDDPSTPTRERPMQVTPQSMRSTRMLVRWIRWTVAQHGGKMSVLCAHRQSSQSRRNDPGEAIWKAVALPLHAELGLSDGGVDFVIGGYPIPEAWDPRCAGIKY